jgi:Na+/melibiose symporter-like transporter
MGLDDGTARRRRPLEEEVAARTRTRTSASTPPRCQVSPKVVPKGRSKSPNRRSKPKSVTTTTCTSTWLSRQREAFGTPFLVCCCVVYFAQGFRSLAGLSAQFFLKDTAGLEPAAMQSLLSTVSLPWSLKPLYGLASDAFPVSGRHRKPYLVLAAIVGVVSWLGLAAVSSGDASASGVPLRLITALLWLSNFSTALSDVIVDAMVAERAGEAARSAARAAGNADDSDGAVAAAGTEGENALQSLCWGSLAVGGLTGSGLGMAASSVPTTTIFALCASCPALVLLASRALVEEPAPAGRATTTGVRAMRRQLGSMYDALRTPAIYLPLLFFFLQGAIVPSCSQAMYFFAADVLGFSQSFMAAQGLAAYLFLLLGTWFYTRFIQGASFVRIFALCQVATVVTSMLDVLLASRASARLGIPDHVFVLGADAIATVLDRVSAQPFFVIAARLCPVGCEATLYAFFMSTSNFSRACSEALGAAIMPLFGVQKGKYDGLTSLLMLRAGCTLLPLALIRPLLGGRAGVDKLQ